MSKATLLEKLTDKEYRDAFISEEIDVGLPMQLRSMRDSRGWKQQYVAEKTGTKQPRFSLMEKAGYGNFSLNTLKKLASLFDVGLIVSFVPWGEMIDFIEAMTSARLNAMGFADEYPRLLRPLLDGHADAVFGSRYLAGDQSRVLPFWHSMINKVLTLVSTCSAIST